MVTGQAPFTLELRNTLGKNTNNPNVVHAYITADAIHDMGSAGGGHDASNRKTYNNRDPGRVAWGPLAGDTTPQSGRHTISESLGGLQSTWRYQGPRERSDPPRNVRFRPIMPAWFLAQSAFLSTKKMQVRRAHFLATKAYTHRRRALLLRFGHKTYARGAYARAYFS